jgi:hypothetical protein
MKSLPLFILFAHPAAASLVYPDAVAEQTMAKNDVTCVLCHTSRAGGAGTVNQPFGKSLRSIGLTGGSNRNALIDALKLLEAEKTDSDKDGVDDITELRQGTNPNRPDNVRTVGGTTAVDSGVTAQDAGSERADGGDSFDAGIFTTDGGFSFFDAGNGMADSGAANSNMSAPKTGCSVGATSVAGGLFVVFALSRRPQNRRHS